MAGTFKIYSDSGLTVPIQSGAPKSVALNYDGSSGNVDFQVFLGSPASSKTIQAASNPGTDQITCTVNDTSIGSGQPATLFKVATTQLGLDTATQTVNLGTTILSGTSNAKPIWVRGNINNGSAVIGVFTDLELLINDVAETG